MIWSALGLLLIGEILFLTIRHDAAALAQSSHPLARLFAAAPDILSILISAAVIALGITAWRLRGRFGEALNQCGVAPGLWPWLPVHIVAFAALNLFSRPVFAAQASDYQYLAWLACAIGTASSWLAVAISPRFWPALLRFGGSVMLASLVLSLAVWGVSLLARSGWESAAAPTFWAARHLLALVSTDVISEPSTFVLGTPGFRVRIAPECSGYEGVGLVCLFLGLYVVLFRRHLRFPHALVLILIGAMAAWLLNVVRIAALIVIGDSVSPALALGGFHSQAGWLAFNAIGLGLVVLAHRSRLFSASAPAQGPNPTAAYLIPLLAIIAAQMVIEAFFNGTPRLYPLRVLIGAACLAYYWRAIDGLAGREVPRAESSLHGFGLAVLGGMTVFLIWVEMWLLFPSDRTLRDPRESLMGLSESAVAIWLIFRVAGSVLVLPVIEETAFRGFLLRRLVSGDFRSVSPRQLTFPALVISSALFGFLHDQWLAGMLAGMLYASVYGHRGRLSDAVIAHATTNAMVTVVTLGSGHWQFWS